MSDDDHENTDWKERALSAEAALDTIKKALRTGWEEMWKITAAALLATRDPNYTKRDQGGWKPCPICGSDDIYVECDLGDVRQVECNVCWTSGRADRWNDRPI